MLKYLIIQLGDNAPSFCHYKTNCNSNALISIKDLKKALLFGMKENLNFQFILPKNKLTDDYHTLIQSVSACLIAPLSYKNKADVYVTDSITELKQDNISADAIYVLRLTNKELANHTEDLLNIAEKCSRLNIILTDIETYNEDCLTIYQQTINELSQLSKSEILNGKNIQMNILTDRLVLDEMNNCNAGWESVTICPDGKFYICPAFYYEGLSVGDLKGGLNIKNPQLYRLDHAPLCQRCDAYQCKRCIWLNQKLTNEVCIPSYQQCVISHIERNASRSLLLELQDSITSLSEKNIKQIDYLDPFETIKK